MCIHCLGHLWYYFKIQVLLLLRYGEADRAGTNAIGRIVCNSQYQEVMPHYWKHESQSRARNGKKELAKTLLWFSGEEWRSRINWFSRFRIGCLNKCSTLQGTGAVLSCLVPGPGVTRAEEYWLRVTGQWRRGLRAPALDWLFCTRKTLSLGSDLLSRNYLASQQSLLVQHALHESKDS
jgi:hypothetical protein